MIRLVTMMLAMSLVAGCTSDVDPEPASTVPEPEDTTAEVQPVEPLPEVATIAWDGALSRGAWACHPELGCEYAPSPTAYNDVFEQSLPVGNVTGGNLSIAWTPASQITDELVIGFRIYAPGCSDCPSRYGTEDSGTSPLNVALPDMYVAEGEVLRLWVYGAFIEGEDTTGTYAGLSDDQPFRVEGDLVIQPPR